MNGSGMAARRCSVYQGRLHMAATLSTEVKMVSEEGLLCDLPVVMSATQLAQRSDESPAAVMIIDGHMIAASAAVKLVELLPPVPRFQIADQIGDPHTVSAEGTATPWFSRVQSLIDGRSVYHIAFSSLNRFDTRGAMRLSLYLD